MTEIFVKSLFESIVIENNELYKTIFKTTNVNDTSNEYWKRELTLYNKLSNEDREALFKLLEQIMIDTVSNILGVIDGRSTLMGCEVEPKLFLSNIDTNSELQDLFLEYVEKLDEI